MRLAFEKWEVTMPSVPEDAIVSHAYTQSEVAAPSTSG